LAAIVKFVVPFPFPEAPDVIVRNDALLVAVHAHPGGAVIVVLPEPCPAPAACEVGAIE
jgi:hypothetical protein